MQKKISIIGLGLIGGSIAKGLKNNKNYFIKAYDKQEVLTEALNEEVINSALTKITDAADSDIIFLCLPTELSLSAFKKLVPLINDETIISDVCGVKGIFEETWNKIKKKGFYIGGHPMTGKEVGGFKNSDSLLFENSVYIISDSEKKSKKTDEVLSVVKNLGARVRLLNPYLHDKIIARVSHLPQLLSVALVNSVKSYEDNEDVNYLDFAAGGFRDMTRIAASGFNIWEPIFKMNKAEIVKAIELLHKNLNILEDSLEKENPKSIKSLFNSAQNLRDEIPKNTKGFINPLVDVFISVKDEPGVLSKLTSLLFNNGIDIKDIELLKIREGTGGTFRVSFENESIAVSAKELISKSGFAAK